jgi:hypothetical protein
MRWHRDDSAKGRTRQCLAIGAMAYLNLLGIDFCFVGEVPAMASTVDNQCRRASFADLINISRCDAQLVGDFADRHFSLTCGSNLLSQFDSVGF